MIALILWPVVFVVVGVLTYALATNPKLAELGKLLYFAGVLALAFTLARATLELSR